MAPARDHKRAYDNDEGPNTGGMGAYSTDDILPRDLEEKIIETIVRPTLDGLERDGIPYKGFLYFGLMLTPDGPKVLEYNCRLGDPETEAILLRADFDLAQACMDAAQGKLGNFRPRGFRCKRLRRDRLKGISRAIRRWACRSRVGRSRQSAGQRRPACGDAPRRRDVCYERW